MAAPKRRKAPSRKKPAVRRDQASEVTRAPAGPDSGKCWLCSQPLSAGAVASVLGPGMFEVHQHCYEQAMRS